MPRLTEQEKQEIIRFIEADKPLPEKYRFLLFEEKREVESAWNSDAGRCMISCYLRHSQRRNVISYGTSV